MGNLPDGFEKYRYFDLSREPHRRAQAGTRASPCCAAAIPPLVEAGRGKKITRLGQVVLSPPPQS